MIDQRDDAACNVLIESRLANYAKVDFAESEYELIKKDILDVKKKCKFFDIPEGPVPAVKLADTDTFRFGKSFGQKWS